MSMFRDLLMQISEGLPSGYTECEYLSISGNGAYIDSLIETTSNTGIDCEYIVSTDVNLACCGAISTEDGKYFRHHMSPNGSGTTINYYWFGYSTDVASSNLKFTPYCGYWQRFKLINFAYERTVLSTGTTNSGSITKFSHNSNIHYGIFGRISNDGSIQSRPCSFRYFKLYDGEELVRDFIPCLDADGVPCMYDNVSKQPFYNQGSGTFGYKTIDGVVVDPT